MRMKFWLAIFLDHSDVDEMVILNEICKCEPHWAGSEQGHVVAVVMVVTQLWLPQTSVKYSQNKSQCYGINILASIFNITFYQNSPNSRPDVASPLSLFLAQGDDLYRTLKPSTSLSLIRQLFPLDEL